MTRLAASPFDSLPRHAAAAILGIGAASPPAIPQEQSFQLARELARPTPEQEAWLKRVFLRSGIETRGSILTGDGAAPLDSMRRFYPAAKSDEDRGPTTGTRMARYAVEAPVLANSAASAALIDADIPASAITHLITVSCTGFFAPGLDAALIERLDLSPALRRIHIGFMGCHAAFNALAAARDTVCADAGAKVLVCCVELCSLHMAYGWDPGKLVANALFADGAAAVVMGRPGAPTAGWELHDTASFLLPHSREAMAWKIGDHGFEMTLLQSVPALIREHLREWCQCWLARHNLFLPDIAAWAIHPGGPKVLSAVAAALDLSPQSLEPSRNVLAHHGNMSSGTILFILEQIAAAGPCVAIGLGPGLMAEAMLLNR